MKLLFVTKPVKMEQLGLMYLSAAAKKARHITHLLTADEKLEDMVRVIQPDFIGYSVMTGDQRTYMDINNKLKKQFQFTSIFGGPHPTFFPEMIAQEGVNVVCRGEGEEALVDLLNNPHDKSIKNLWFNDSGRIRGNDIRPLSNIDELYFPDRTLFGELSKGPITHLIASRGCPFSCGYCFNEKYSELYKNKGQRVRFRDPHEVVGEAIKATTLSNPANKNVKFVYFQDDTFTLNVDWLREFSKEYSRSVGKPFHCHVRANTCDDERVNLLRESGCYSVHLAAETANDRLRNEVLNRNMSVEQIVGSCSLLRSRGIKIMLQNMIGLPTGTIQDDLATLEMNIRCKPDYAWVSIFQPYPGTALGDFCKQKGFYKGNFNDIGSNFYDGSPLEFSPEYKLQLKNLQKIFAYIVEKPKLFPGAVSIMIDAKHQQARYDEIYRTTREKADERLYGFSLTKKEEDNG